MTQMKATMWVVLAGAAFLSVAFFAMRAKPLDEASFRFRSSSNHKLAQLEDCFNSPRGREVFADFKGVVSRGNATFARRVYVSSDNSEIVLSALGDGSVISFSSPRPAREDEVDLLNWCTEIPGFTWVPPSVR